MRRVKWTTDRSHSQDGFLPSARGPVLLTDNDCDLVEAESTAVGSKVSSHLIFSVFGRGLAIPYSTPRSTWGGRNETTTGTRSSALCRLFGNPEDTMFEGKPMWMSYLEEVDVVLKEALGDTVWEAIKDVGPPQV